MAVFNEPTKWAQTLGKDADVVKIPDIAGDTDPSIDKIFPAVFSIPLAHGGKAIPRSVLNGLFKLLGDWIYYIQNGGIASYSAIFDYAIGRVVFYNGNLYKCIHANGASSTVVTPDSNTAYWQRLDNSVRSVNGVNADASGNVALTQLVTGLTSPTFLEAVKGKALVFSNAQDGYIAFTRGASTNGVFLQEIYHDRYMLHYISNDRINADINVPNKDVILLDETGNSSFPGIVSGTFSGDLSGTASHATSADSATKAIQDGNGAQIDTTYFKSANGTFTGAEYKRNVANSYLKLSGGNTSDGGANLQLYGKDSTAYKGEFLIEATNGSDYTYLHGYPTGKLTWRGNNIVRSVNGVNADDNGNVQTGFPSDTFITIFENITNTATVSTEAYKKSYIAPANGYVWCRGQRNANDRESACYIVTNKFSSQISSGPSARTPTSLYWGGTVPVKKGDTINFLIYNLQVASAKFIYAEGEI